jgi:hypothetical protein
MTITETTVSVRLPIAALYTAYYNAVLVACSRGITHARQILTDRDEGHRRWMNSLPCGEQDYHGEIADAKCTMYTDALETVEAYERAFESAGIEAPTIRTVGVAGKVMAALPDTENLVKFTADKAGIDAQTDHMIELLLTKHAEQVVMLTDCIRLR